MKKISVVLFMSLILSIMLSGCASPPTEEINATNEVLKSIETPDVNTYAPESLKMAQDELNKALAEVKVQEEKFALTRDYKEAVAMLKSAKELADKAKEDALANKAKAKAEAEAAIAELPQIIQDATAILAKAPKGKDTKADLEAMQNDLKLAEEAVTEANDALTTEQYPVAIEKAASAKAKAAAIIEQVNAAREKLKR